MATYNAKTERLAAVNNAKGCTNFGAMAIDGMKAWALKSDGEGENAKSVLYYCSNVDTESEAFLQAILIPACASSSLAFLMMYSTYKLNKQGDNIQA